MLQLTQIVLLLLLLKSTQSSNIPQLDGCQKSCGEIPIPYPFGIGDGCSLSDDYNITCDTKRYGKPTPFLSYFMEIVNISVSLGQARFNMPIYYQCYDTTTNKEVSGSLIGLGFTSSYWLNNEKNKFIVTGCNTFASFTYINITNTTSYTTNYTTGYRVGCLSTCNSLDSLSKHGASCAGIGCCRTDIPIATNDFIVDFDGRYNHLEVYNFSRCSYAMITDSVGFQFDISYATSDKLINKTMPAVFDWVIGDTTCEEARNNKSSYACISDHSACLNYITGIGYRCNCSEGYQGNPYIPDGCQDIDECALQNPCPGQAVCHNVPGNYSCSPPKCSFGRHSNSKSMCELNLALVIGGCASIVILSFIGFAMFIVLLERRKFSKEKEKYFKHHGGWILLEKIKSTQGFGFTIFTRKQVEEATNSFDNSYIIGHGGQGTVYKGSLRDQEVAIKKCKIVDESKKKEFGKEMVILSQINHKNIVKLLGCCLEVEIPMLIYEFIPNGTLFQYIHYKEKGTYLSLKTRLRIAQESAEALAYLHTTASPPIFHGDVKSTNILLDQNHSAKVSDFGASILAPTDESQFVTLVQGTCGYLDPEYMQSSRLTDKSDVYSFGVVLLELLTSKPVFDFEAPEEERGLSSRFLSVMEEKKLHELLDNEITSENDMELVTQIAELAKECINMKGADRPTMKEVAEELDRISKLHQHPWSEEYHYKDDETFLDEPSHDTETNWLFRV